MAAANNPEAEQPTKEKQPPLESLFSGARQAYEKLTSEQNVEMFKDFSEIAVNSLKWGFVAKMVQERGGFIGDKAVRGYMGVRGVLDILGALMSGRITEKENLAKLAKGAVLVGSAVSPNKNAGLAVGAATAIEGILNRGG